MGSFEVTGDRVWLDVTQPKEEQTEESHSDQDEGDGEQDAWLVLHGEHRKDRETRNTQATQKASCTKGPLWEVQLNWMSWLPHDDAQPVKKMKKIISSAH